LFSYLLFKDSCSFNVINCGVCIFYGFNVKLLQKHCCSKHHLLLLHYLLDGVSDGINFILKITVVTYVNVNIIQLLFLVSLNKLSCWFFCKRLFLDKLNKFWMQCGCNNFCMVNPSIFVVSWESKMQNIGRHQI